MGNSKYVDKVAEKFWWLPQYFYEEARAMENRKRNNRRRRRLKTKLATMTAMVLVLMLGIMGTMAYLSTVSDPKKNTFTGSEGILLDLTEPGWDADDDGVADDGDGMKDAQSYTPGRVIAKDPILENTSSGTEDAPEWVAIAVSYTVGNDAATTAYMPVSYEAMKYLIKDIAFYDSAAATTANSADNTIAVDEYWIPIYVTTAAADGAIDDTSITLTDNSMSDTQAFAIYLYSKTLAKNSSTPALFKQIEIRDTTTLEGTTGLSALTTYVKTNDSTFLTTDYSVNGNLPSFEIDVIGAAVKNEYDKDGASGTLATSISELSATDKNQLIKDLVEVLEPKIAENVRKVGGTTTP